MARRKKLAYGKSLGGKNRLVDKQSHSFRFYYTRAFSENTADFEVMQKVHFP